MVIGACIFLNLFFFQVIENLNELKARIIVYEEIIDDTIGRFEEHELCEVEKRANEYGVKIEIDKCVQH